MDNIEKFWKEILAEEKACNVSASWIGNTEKENEKVKKSEQKNITILELKAALIKSQKWALAGLTKL